MRSFKLPGEENVQRLIQCTSDDETRCSLTGIHFDGTKWVSTDGHRMLVVDNSVMPGWYTKGAVTGSIYEKSAFKAEALKVIEGKYPAWQSLVPLRLPTWIFRTTIPLWFKGIKKKDKATVGLLNDGNWTLGRALVHVDAHYLACLAGLDVKISVVLTDEKVSPLKIESIGDDGWHYILMPMREPDVFPGIVELSGFDKPLEIAK